MSIGSITSKAAILLMAIMLLSCARDSQPGKYRVVILSDMTHDDGNSLIRYLYYAPYFDLEALIVTNQLPDFNYDDSGPWDKAMGILDAYKEILPQLRKHDNGFPGYEQLVEVTKRGSGTLPIIWLTNTLHFIGDIAGRHVESRWDSIYFHDWIGEGLNPNGIPKDSEGSDFLIEVFNKKDDRPIYVQAWGGPITFVQALYRYRQRYGDDQFNRLLPKIRLYGILFQDITFEYFVDFIKMQDNTCAGFGTAVPTYGQEPIELGQVLYENNHFWTYVFGNDPSWVIPMHYKDVNGHGPLSDIYDHGGEGDTPAFLYLLSGALGLNDPSDPTMGSWGGLFKPMGADFPQGYYTTCNINSEVLEKWIPDARKSFQNRLLWTLKEPSEVNREPVAIVNDDHSNKIIRLKGNPGETITLDASRSYDPDKDQLNFNWYRYSQADNYTGSLLIPNPEVAVQHITVPDDLAENNSIHIILEVRDNGSPDLVTYRRVIISLL
jgi:hypothetical protein